MLRPGTGRAPDLLKAGGVADDEAGDVFKTRGGNAGSRLDFGVVNFKSFYVRANDGGAHIIFYKTCSEVCQFEVADVAGEEAVCGHDANPAGFGITRPKVPGMAGSVFAGAATFEFQADVVETDVLDVISRLSGNLDAAHGIYSSADDI